MRSTSLAHAIAVVCAAWTTGSILFFPAAANAQTASPWAVGQQTAAQPDPVGNPRPLTLAEALSLAEAANPSLRAKQAQLAAAQGTRADAGALLFNNPQVTTDITRRQVPMAGLPTERRQEWSVGVSQTLEIAGQRGYRRDAAEAALTALQSEIADARRAARAESAERFYRVLALQQRVGLETQALKLFESTAAAIQKRRAAGEDTKLDANIALVEAERARNQLAIAQEQLASARAQLATTIQLPAESLPEVHGELALLPRQFMLTELLSAADAQPRLQALVARERSAASRLKLEQASVYPDVTLGLNVGREGMDSARERLTTLSVSLPLPLFKRNATGIGQAQTDLSQVQIERQAAQRNTRANVNMLWQRMQSLEARVKRLQDSMLPALDDNQRLSVKSQQAGQIGLLELIVVNRQALDARRDLNDALTEYHATRLELELAAGWPLQTSQP